jgi:hypothetical protein
MNQEKLQEKFSKEQILEVITNSYAFVGYKQDVDDIRLLLELMFVHANKSWKRYKLSEIIYFINLGLKGIFGNFAGLSMATFCQFETNYQKNENNYYRKEYLRLNPLPVLEAIEQHTESGKDEIVIDAMISKLKSKNYTDADLNVWYDFLEQKGAIKLDRWKQYKTEGAEKYTKELHKRSNFAQHNNLKDLYNEIKKALDLAKESKYDVIELTYYSKVYFMELTFCTDENINKLETFLKTK